LKKKEKKKIFSGVVFFFWQVGGTGEKSVIRLEEKEKKMED